MKKYVQSSLYLIAFLIILSIIVYYIINHLIGSMVSEKAEANAVAVFKTDKIEGEVVVSDYRDGVKLKADFTKLPPGKHGFHIHKAGDLRGEGCMGLCEHYDIGNNSHGGEPNHGDKSGNTGERHTGDLGNIELKNGKFSKTYYIKGTNTKDLWGRSIIVHADEDDLGKGGHEDSKVTGHSGARIGCAIFGRTSCKPKYNTTRKNKK
jgi:Cu-Zn family superoxide dismutase